MTEPGTVPLRHLHGGLCLGALALLLSVAALADAPRDAGLLVAAGRVPEPAAAASAAPPAPAQPRHIDPEQQRRLLLLLVMRSAGPLGSYGALGR
jgi:hypothetical protein